MIAYLTVIVAGLTIVVFMVKPLSSGPRQRKDHCGFEQKARTLLFAFVDRVARLVGAPLLRPSKWISRRTPLPRSGADSPSFLSNDLTPSRSDFPRRCLTVSQFAGVLAHEFGHFSRERPCA